MALPKIQRCVFKKRVFKAENIAAVIIFFAGFLQLLHDGTANAGHVHEAIFTSKREALTRMNKEKKK